MGERSPKTGRGEGGGRRCGAHHAALLAWKGGDWPRRQSAAVTRPPPRCAGDRDRSALNSHAVGSLAGRKGRAGRVDRKVGCCTPAGAGRGGAGIRQPPHHGESPLRWHAVVFAPPTNTNTDTYGYCWPGCLLCGLAWGERSGGRNGRSEEGKKRKKRKKRKNEEGKKPMCWWVMRPATISYTDLVEK